MSYNHKQVSKINDEVQRIYEEKINSKASDRLKKDIKTCLMTAFIFALAESEENFGHLWGEDIAEGTELTDEQAKYDDIYEKFRKSVLDNGNHQIRIMERLIDRFDIRFK